MKKHRKIVGKTVKTTQCILLFLLVILFMTACKDDENTASVFELAATDLIKNIDKDAVIITIPVETNLNYEDWNVKSDNDWVVASKRNSNFGKPSIILSVKGNQGIDVRNTQVKVTSSIKSHVIVIKQYGENDVVVEENVPIYPSGAKADQYQLGRKIERSYDGDFKTNYHSPWYGSTKMPVTLEYFFTGETEIDYFIYYTYPGNGCFGELEVYTATDADRNEYKLQGNYNFNMKGAPSKVYFEKSVKATGIKFVVKSGSNNYASCYEMCFFKKNKEKKLDQQLLDVFTDLTCTALKLDVTTEAINALPNYFIRLVEAFQSNTYDEWEKEFRIRNYAAYSNVEEWAGKLMTKKYGNLDNPTGISVNEGDEIIVLVGDTHKQAINLQCIGEETVTSDKGNYLQVASSGDMYPLEPGINKITVRNPGQLFVMYNTDITNPTASPITIHIPLGSGKVTGFFDLKEHKTDAKYAQLLSKATHKYFCVRGDKIMFYFHTADMRSVVEKQILSAINLWDDIIGWQQELMRIENMRPREVNNHIFAISPEGSYMWASNYRIAFVHTYLKNILLKENVMVDRDNAWGPAHEIGHIHQSAINWPGSTESSNNLFSNYVMYKLGKYCSRGSGLSSLAHSRFANKDAWYNMGNPTHQNEDTEIHLRMNWQLWNYYHRCEYKKDFWQTLFKLLRENRIDENDPGAGQLLFAQMASKAANQDLSAFFEMWGFFEPVDGKVEQYGKWEYVVTQSMIDKAKAYMKQFPAPKHAFYYLEDRKKGDVGLDGEEIGDVGHYTQFKNNVKITKKVTYTLSGQSVAIQNGEEAVAYEIRKDNKLVFFSNFQSFNVPSSIDISGASIYAIQADGTKVQALQ